MLDNFNFYMIKLGNSKKFLVLLSVNELLPIELRSVYPTVIFCNGNKFISCIKDNDIQIITKYSLSEIAFFNFIEQNNLDEEYILKQAQLFFLSNLYPERDLNFLKSEYNQIIEYVEKKLRRIF